MHTGTPTPRRERSRRHLESVRWHTGPSLCDDRVVAPAYDPERDIRRLLDRAHAHLDERRLVEVLLATKLAVEPLLVGAGPPAGRGVAIASAAALEYLRPIRTSILIAARRVAGQSGAEVPELGRRLDRYIDDVAARPRTAAVLAA